MYDRNAARGFADNCGTAAGWVFWTLWITVVLGTVVGMIAAISVNTSAEGVGGMVVFGIMAGIGIGWIPGYAVSRILLAQKYSLLSLVDLEEKTPKRIAIATTEKPDARGVQHQEPKGTGIVANQNAPAGIGHDTQIPR